MKKLFASVLAIMCCFCFSSCQKIMSIEEASEMNTDEILGKLEGLYLEQVRDVWGEPMGSPEAIFSDLFETEDKVIMVMYDSKERIEGIRKLHWSEGRYVKGKNGNMVLIEYNGYTEPVSVSGEDIAFSGFGDGDRIRILVDGIAETYPGQTFVYRTEFLEEGSYEDLDTSVMEQIREMGWVE